MVSTVAFRSRLGVRQWLQVVRFRRRLRLIGQMAALWATTTGLEEIWLDEE